MFEYLKVTKVTDEWKAQKVRNLVLNRVTYIISYLGFLVETVDTDLNVPDVFAYGYDELFGQGNVLVLINVDIILGCTVAVHQLKAFAFTILLSIGLYAGDSLHYAGGVACP